jgi:sulfur relay (sulfurtransferase) DsrC/TusE family protein
VEHFFGRGNVSPTHSELCRFVSGSYAKHQVSSPITILLKKFVCISHRNVLARCDLIFTLLRCQGV